MTLILSILSGLSSHFVLYDVCRTLPFPELASHAAGVMVAYPIAKDSYNKKKDFDFAFLITFLGVGIGVMIGRILRGIKEVF